MCGIIGWVSYQKDLGSQRQVAEAMTETMSCRGPDDSGIWLSQHAAMGHRRLAVIDLVGGRQPMTAHTRDGAITLVYSGECYNYRQLRDELSVRGRRFRTSSDTEVLLQGYLEWGDGVLDRLTGMFAFAIWDERSERLVLARDRMGVKPLYYYLTDDGVIFGSEPKAILANPMVDRIVDIDGLREMFGFTKTPGAAIWRGMQEVIPGTVVTVDRSGHRSRTYWALSFHEHEDDLPTTIDRVRELLADVVAGQLVADVPVCLLLSGGLDSSALAAMAATRLREDQAAKLRTVAVDFVGQAQNFVPDGIRDTPDAPFVRDVAQFLGTEHRDILLDPAAVAHPATRRATVSARDMPLGHGDLDYSLYLLFSAIRAHSTVALSGEAADEVFGGYRWFHDPEVQAAEMFPWLDPRAVRQLGRVFMLEPGLASNLNLGDYVMQRYQEAVSEIPVMAGEDDVELRARRLSYLFLTRFVRLLLDRKDRISMAVGLEVRVPFCDHVLVDYVFNTPWSFKTFDGREKSLLRAAVQDDLPRSVVQRVKSPYPSTQDLAYVAELQRQARTVLRAKHPASDLFDRPRLADITSLAPQAVTPRKRAALERMLDVAAWLDTARPVLKIG